MLEQSYEFQIFERDCDETKGWINEKLKTASDENYLVGSFYYLAIVVILVLYELRLQLHLGRGFLLIYQMIVERDRQKCHLSALFELEDKLVQS